MHNVISDSFSDYILSRGSSFTVFPCHTYYIVGRILWSYLLVCVWFEGAIPDWPVPLDVPTQVSLKEPCDYQRSPRLVRQGQDGDPYIRASLQDDWGLLQPLQKPWNNEIGL